LTVNKLKDYLLTSLLIYLLTTQRFWHVNKANIHHGYMQNKTVVQMLYFRQMWTGAVHTHEL